MKSSYGMLNVASRESPSGLYSPDQSGALSLMPHAFAAAGFLAMAVLGCHSTPQQTADLQLGATRIPYRIHTADRPGPAFLVLHADEQTAVQAGREAIRARGGRLIEIVAQGGRYVRFEMDGETWRFDPNRIFTEAGAEATLRARSGSASPEILGEALAEVRRFATAVLDAYRSERGLPSHVPVDFPIITLHNNTEGDYSAASYLPDGDHAEDAIAVHLPDEADPDDFFFVTDPAIYDGLVAEGFTVVLQDNAQAADDGSLSVWASRQGIPYVNVEAEHGHRERQIAMLEGLARVLDAVSRSSSDLPSTSERSEK